MFGHREIPRKYPGRDGGLGDFGPVPTVLLCATDSPHLLGGSVAIPEEFSVLTSNVSVQVQVYEVLDMELHQPRSRVCIGLLGESSH